MSGSLGRPASDGSLVSTRAQSPTPPASSGSALLMIPPDPGVNVAAFLAWLKKVGGAYSYDKTLRKWVRALNVDSIIKTFGPTKLVIERSRGGERVIRLVDVSWGDQWAVHYDVEFPHHAGRKAIKTRR